MKVVFFSLGLVLLSVEVRAQAQANRPQREPTAAELLQRGYEIKGVNPWWMFLQSGTSAYACPLTVFNTNPPTQPDMVPVIVHTLACSVVGKPLER